VIILVTTDETKIYHTCRDRW